MAHGRQNRDAFTLTELLVVIVVLGLLIAVILPTMAQVAPIARRVRCAGNLRNLGAAYHARLADEVAIGLTPLMPDAWVVDVMPYLGSHQAALTCPERDGGALSPPAVRMFVWGSGGAEREDYFLNVTTAYPYWLEMPCKDVYPPPGLWKVAEVKLHGSGLHNEAFGLEGFAGGRNNTNVLPVYTPGPDPNVYWFVIETARYGENLYAGGDLDYDDIVIRVTENRTVKRLEMEPIRIWKGQAYNLVGPDGTWWPSGTKSQSDNRDKSVGDNNTMGPYYFPMGETSYGMSLYAEVGLEGRKILALDYDEDVVNVGPHARADDGWDMLRAPRHIGKSNVLFADGSVTTLAPDTIDPDIDANDALYWDPDR